MGPPVSEPSICVGPKSGRAKFNLPCFSVCKIFASNLPRLACSLIYSQVKSHLLREAFLISSYKVGSLDTALLNFIFFKLFNPLSEIILFLRLAASPAHICESSVLDCLVHHSTPSTQHRAWHVVVLNKHLLNQQMNERTWDSHRRN